MKKTVAWVEIPAEDFNRATKFYSVVLKSELKNFEFEHEKMAIFPSEDGAISYAKDFHPSENGTLVSLNVNDDLDGAIERVVINGGKIIIPRTKIESEGKKYFALFIDSEGNKVGLYGE